GRTSAVGALRVERALRVRMAASVAGRPGLSAVHVRKHGQAEGRSDQSRKPGPVHDDDAAGSRLSLRSGGPIPADVRADVRSVGDLSLPATLHRRKLSRRSGLSRRLRGRAQGASGSAYYRCIDGALAARIRRTRARVHATSRPAPVDVLWRGAPGAARREMVQGGGQPAYTQLVRADGGYDLLPPLRVGRAG